MFFEWKGKQIPVTHPTVDEELARKALDSVPFRDWAKRCAKENGEKKIDLRSVEIQNVDLFGKGYVQARQLISFW